MLSIIQNIVSEYISNNDKKNLLKSSLEIYLSKLQYRFRQTKNIVFRNEPSDFNKNYIPLTLVSSHDVIRIKNSMQLFEKYDKIGIIGSAGSGKTTLLRYLTLDCIDKNYKIPIYIELRNYTEFLSNFEDFIISQINEEVSDEIKSLFKSDQFLFIFDGFDEIDYREGDSLINQIYEFINNYSSNHFIISSRPGTNLESITPLFIFFIEPLNNNDIYLFIEKLNIQTSLKTRILDSINEDNQLLDILNIPLFLSIYVISFNSNNYDHVDKKSIFFRNIIDSLFSHHDSITKLGYVREKISELSKDELEKIASSLAFRMFFSNKYALSKDELFREFEIIKKNGNYTYESEKLLFDLTITINLIISYENHFSFPHILLLEYLSALFISRIDDINKEVIYIKINENNAKYLSSSFYEFLFELDEKSFTFYYLLPNIKELLDNYFYKNPSNKLKIIHSFISQKIFKKEFNVSILELENLKGDIEFDLKNSKKGISDNFFDIL